jgi:hypothetical protein
MFQTSLPKNLPVLVIIFIIRRQVTGEQLDAFGYRLSSLSLLLYLQAAVTDSIYKLEFQKQYKSKRAPFRFID